MQKDRLYDFKVEVVNKGNKNRIKSAARIAENATYDERSVRNADEIIVLEHGKIIERGTHDQLIAAKGRYYFLYTGNRITLDE